MTYALNGVRWAEKHGRIPVINFDGATTPAFYDPAKGSNVWEYYFEPVASLTSAQAQRAEQAGRTTVNMSLEEFGFLHHSDPGRIATFWSYDRPSDPAAWMKKKRELGRRYVKSYLRVKPQFHQIVDSFWNSRLAGRPVLGVHIRGSDFNYADTIAPSRYFALLDRYLERLEWSDARIFLATDQSQFVDQFRQRYPDRLVSRECFRAEGEIVPIVIPTDYNNYMKGEEVLVDALLLSRCQHLIKGPAALGEYALWFNPSLTCDDFALECDFDPRTRAAASSAFRKLNLADTPRWKHRLILMWDSASLCWARASLRIGRRLRGLPRTDVDPDS